jgi:uncharacterized protein (TIGR00255 family)
MTGFGKAEKSTKKYYTRIEIKSVNNRYLDLQFRIPKNLISIESRLRKVMERYISRGSVLCLIQYEDLEGRPGPFKLNKPVLRKYLDIIETIKKDMGVPHTVEISEFLKIPEMISNIPADLETKVLESQIIPVFEDACLSLVNMRIQEGRALVRNILERVKSFKRWVREIKAKVPERQREYFNRTREKIESLVDNRLILDEPRLMTELGILSEKLDITEEIDRFESHISLFLDTIKVNRTPGKKLGFILQEMVREINTLSSKCQSSEIQHGCVSMKEELEIVREQVQNIE